MGKKNLKRSMKNSIKKRQEILLNRVVRDVEIKCGEDVVSVKHLAGYRCSDTKEGPFPVFEVETENDTYFFHTWGQSGLYQKSKFIDWETSMKYHVGRKSLELQSIEGNEPNFDIDDSHKDLLEVFMREEGLNIGLDFENTSLIGEYELKIGKLSVFEIDSKDIGWTIMHPMGWAEISNTVPFNSFEDIVTYYMGTRIYLDIIKIDENGNRQSYSTH